MQQPRIWRNDYGQIQVPDIGGWKPTKSVSVIIPAHGHQQRLDVVLASLAEQTYPAELIEVVVMDDSSDPPLRLPEIRPENTRVEKPLPGGWASAHAVNSGVEKTDGEIIFRLDSDMLVFRDHIEAQVRWHHQADYLVGMGHKLFVDYDEGDLDPAEVQAAVREGRAGELFHKRDAKPHWIENIIESNDQLRSYDYLSFRVMTGATCSLTRDMFKAAGGMDAELILGGDTEFGHRLAQAGAVFVPDGVSSSWHLGASQMQRRSGEGTRFREPGVTNRVPERRRNELRPNRQWRIPLIDIFVDTTGYPYKDVRLCVNALLDGLRDDIRVNVIRDSWPVVDSSRRQTLDDPELDGRLITQYFESDPRVHFVEKVAEAPLVPYRLFVPVKAKIEKYSVFRLLKVMRSERLGLIELDSTAGTIRMERTAAISRARHLATPGENVDQVVAHTFGRAQSNIDGEQAARAWLTLEDTVPKTKGKPKSKRPPKKPTGKEPHLQDKPAPKPQAVKKPKRSFPARVKGRLKRMLS